MEWLSKAAAVSFTLKAAPPALQSEGKDRLVGVFLDLSALG